MSHWLQKLLVFGAQGVLILSVLQGDGMPQSASGQAGLTGNSPSQELTTSGKPSGNHPDKANQAELSVAAFVQSQPSSKEAPEGLETATLGGGCFWCLEAIFQQLQGVRKVTSGYSGGWVKNPTYKQVCTGTTGHAEVVQILFNPSEISYEELLEVFFAIHDPTTPNRQGPDIGPQYRSIILYHNPKQREAAVRIKERLERSAQFTAPIVTEIVPFEAFYPAEAYHQDYFRRNPNQPYCQAIIAPKLEKFKKRFSNKLQPVDSPAPSRKPAHTDSPGN